jgi:hypothetical protein
MSKINFGGAVNDMRKSLKDTVYARNTYGAYARNRTFPTQPNTASQQNVKTEFSARSGAWKNLTEDQRQSWILGAPNFPMPDVFGNIRILSPATLYQQLNLNLFFTGTSPISTCPARQGCETVGTLSITADEATFMISVSSSFLIVPDDRTIIVYATPLLSPGIYFAKKYFRVIGLVAPTKDWNTKNLYGFWEFLYGSLTATNKIFIKAKLVNTITGECSVPSISSCIIT